MMRLINLQPANDEKHKYMATFELNGRTHKVKFGALGYNDYINYCRFSLGMAEERKNQYIRRHQVREDWTDITKPGTWSRYILWNKPTLKESLSDMRQRFSF